MTHDPKEMAFLSAVRAELDKDLEQLDGATLMQLSRIRRQALDRAVHRPHRWLFPVGGLAATAAVALLAAGLWWSKPLGKNEVPILEDIQILSSTEDLQLLEDMDVLLLLGEENRAAPPHNGGA